MGSHDAEMADSSIEEDHELAQNDAELLAFQKQRSTPKVSLTHIGLDDENVVLEIDNFGQIAAKQTDGGNVDQQKAQQQLGMAPAGYEQKLYGALKRAGSFEPQKLAYSPMLKAGGPMSDEDGSKKQEVIEEEEEKIDEEQTGGDQQ